MTFISIFSVFALACFVDYYAGWSVKPALAKGLMPVMIAKEKRR